MIYLELRSHSGFYDSGLRFRIPDSGFQILTRQYSAQSLWDSVRAHDMFFFVCSVTLFYLQRSSFLFAAFLFFICSVLFLYLQRFPFLFAAFLFCLQRFFFVCRVPFLFAACPLWATVENVYVLQ